MSTKSNVEMNVETNYRLKFGTDPEMDPEKENEEFRQRLIQAAETIVKADEGKIASTIMPEIISCDYQKRTATFRYEFLPWMLNCNDVMHGGMICMIMDSSMGWLCCGYPKEFLVTPSVSMNVSYLEPIFKRDHIVVVAELNGAKGKICYAEAKMYYEDDMNTPLATTVGEYYRMGRSVQLHTEQ